ncbi:MAG: C1 family peptidase [Bacteroidales bacterium]|jgi:C1A family cysteine protease|nr:C1 family peptidase [Bacteroidales bacterium]
MMIINLRLSLMLICIMFLKMNNAQIKESINEMNPDYLKWVDNRDQTQTSEHTLGYRPHPFVINTELPASERVSLKADFAPVAYDLRSIGGVTSVKDQGGCGSCWTFATMASVESFWLLSGKGTFDLSEDNLNTCHTPFEWAPCDGGNAYLSSAYLMRGSGPFSEADDPYSDTHTSVDCPIGLIPQSFVTAAWFLPTNDPELIKSLIIQYGALATNMHWVSSAYNSSDYTYYYSGVENTNHAVTLVGWDDSKTTAGGTGAWIIKNSWGPGWGDDGYFYIAYQDSRVNTSLAVFPEYKDFIADAEVSTYSEAGWITQVGYGTNTVDALVKFTANGDIQIDRIATAAVQAGTIISIEIYDSFNGSNSLTGLLGSIPAQTCTYTGYHSFELPAPIELSIGDDYYIKTSYQTTDYGYPIPVEEVVDGFCTPSISTGIFWVKGTSETSWSLLDGYGWDPCVYVYTSPQSVIDNNVWVSNETWASGSNECVNALNQITVAGTGPVLIQSGASANFIAGQSIRFLPGFHAQNGSTVNAWITTDASFCDALPAPVMAAPPIAVEKSIEENSMQEENNLFDEKSIKVYPNPNSGVFTVSLEGFDSEVRVMIFNTAGQLIYSRETTGKSLSIEMPDMRRGIYFVKAISNSEHFNRKIVLR